RHGILEPDGGRPEAPVSAMDLIVVPGLGFDPEGGRLGWGAGYYDRVLARRGARAVTIGLAYESQILPALPRDAHDVAMDVVATEARWMERRPEPGAGNPEDPGTSE
ncbi:MAG: 5-formyltetrahydrofolate cyclo-ligase, partial [Myxococcales bacterium]|nr:5-formyltetrahydrofolate cyclo-ligase [Myxococcales bacterium]